MPKSFILIILLALLAACSQIDQPSSIVDSAAPVVAAAQNDLEEDASEKTTDLTPADPTAEPTATGLPAATSLPTATSLPIATLMPDGWKDLPVLPTELSETAYQIYLKGQQNDLNPQAFSKVGDCNSIFPDFLTWYDLKPETIRLGEYSYLQGALDHFAGSWGRDSLSAKTGLTATAVMAPLWADWKLCEVNETPLDCEYRIHQPAFAIISFGTNDANGLVPFEPALRTVIEHTMELGIVPILSTKPDNAEGDHSINRLIVELAREYEIPLWNFWASLQHLPDKGMMAPEHLSYSSRISWVNFEARASMTYGWTLRNLGGLQVMDAMQDLVDERENIKP